MDRLPPLSSLIIIGKTAKRSVWSSSGIFAFLLGGSAAGFPCDSLSASHLISLYSVAPSPPAR